jgi:hypothetical protein
MVFLQILLVSVSFPLSELFTVKPLFYIDAPFHWYQMKVAVNLAKTGTLVGYDPFFGAGYPAGIMYNISAKFPALLAVLLQGRANEMIIYKVFCFVSAILAPVSLIFALRILRLSTREVFAGSVLGIILWWTSIFRWYYTAGMVSFVISSYLTILYLAVMFRCWNGIQSRSGLLFLAGLGAFGMLLHPFFPVAISIAVLAYGALHWNSLTLRQSGMVLIGVPVFILLVSLLWLTPVFRYADVLGDEAKAAPYQKLVDVNLIWKELIGIWAGSAHGSKLYAPLAIASLWGCLWARDSMKQKLCIAFAVSGGALIVFAAVGAAVPVLDTLQPNRFAPVGYLFLVVPAALGLLNMIDSGVHAGRAAQRWGALGCIGLILVPASYAINEVRREVSSSDVGHYGLRPPEVRGLGDRSRWILAWLTRETTSAGRVLFETSKGRIHDGGHLAGYYAYTADREFIGGPYPFQHFAGFWDGWLFNRPIAQIGAEEFKKYTDLYNVGWIIAHSVESKRYFDRIPGVVPVDQFEELKAYRIDRKLSFFLQGAGRIKKRGHNDLLLSDLAGAAATIKYHFVPGMKSDPPATIVPVRLLDDPNPFIRILNPPTQLRLYLP